MSWQPISQTNHTSGSDETWEIHLPASVMQFLCLLHNLRPRDPLWASPEFLHALAGVVYPADVSEVCLLLWTHETLTVHISLVLFTVYFLQGVAVSCPTSVGGDIFRGQSNQKPVWDFIRILLMDSLLNVSANTNTHPLVLLLEVNVCTHTNTNNFLLYIVIAQFKLNYWQTYNTYRIFPKCFPTEKRLFNIL